MPEIASRHHLELVDAVTADALERAGTRLDGIDTVAVTRGPGLIGALLVGLSSAKALAAARRLPLVPVDHLHGHVVASTLGRRSRSSLHTCAWWQAAATPSSRAWTIRRPTPCSARRSTTPPARPSTRARGCSGSATPAGRRSTASRATATRRPSSSRAARPVSSTSASAGSRRHCCTGSAISATRPEAARRTWRPPTSARSWKRSRRGPPRRSSARASSGSRSAAAWRPTRACGRRSASSASQSGCRRWSSARTTPR